MKTAKKQYFVGGITLDQAIPFINLPLNQFPLGHFIYSNEIRNYLDQHRFKRFFIYRDPRDWLVSCVYWNSNPGVNLFPSNLLTFSEKLDFMLVGLGALSNGKSMFTYGRYIEWLKDPNCCSVKFEDLVGPQGGGKKEKQVAAIKKICNYIGYRLSNLQIIKLADNLWGNTNTFREGKIGSWKSHFSKEQINLVKKLSGSLLIELGYEKDLNW